MAILNPKNFFIKDKIIFGMLLMVCSITVFAFLFFPHVQKKAAVDALKEKALSLAEVTAINSSAGLVFEDVDSVNQVLSSVTSNKDLEFAVIFLNNGKIFASYNQEKMVDAVIARNVNEPRFISNSALIGISVPVTFEKKVIASLSMGFTKAYIHDAVSRNRLLVLTICVLILVLSFFSSVIFAQYLVAPINSVVHMLKDIAEGEGDLTKRVNVDASDETGNLARNFNLFIGKIEKIFSIIKNIYLNLAQSIRRIATLAQQIADGAQEQTAIYESLSTSVQDNAQNAKSANALSQEITNNAQKTEFAMNDTFAAMNAIEKSSSQISEVVSIITDIAEQTNLLALNAAIEAARAGEHGKGFAVVADEVRKLAETSAHSANTIRGFVSESLNQVKRGVEVSHSAGENVREILANISLVARQLEDISAATQAQADSMEQNLVITESYAFVAGQLLSTSKQMNVEAEELQKLISKFKVK